MASSQLDTIKQILRNEGKIDNFRCFENKITLRLGARIWDLKKEGWLFEIYQPEDNKKNYGYSVVHDPEKKQEQTTLFN